MLVKSAKFIASYGQQTEMPDDKNLEIAFIGRSNVGKSSLINMLCGRKELAKISGKPGKTQSINRFLINETWMLVDLPGYGYAQVSKTKRELFSSMISYYLLERKQLAVVCILIDGRIPPQKIDLDFIHWCGTSNVPFALVFTKTEKIKKTDLAMLPENYIAALHKVGFDDFPEMITTSAVDGTGKDELLNYFGEIVLNK